MMWDVRVCTACLATNVRMYSMSSYSLLQPYQLLTGRQLLSGDGMPRKLCWECAALVKKLNLFRQKCERAHLLLLDLYNQHDEISEEDVEKVDRNSHGLSSNLSKCIPSDVTLLDLLLISKKLTDKHVKTHNPDVIKVKPEDNTIKTEELQVEFGLNESVKQNDDFEDGNYTSNFKVENDWLNIRDIEKHKEKELKDLGFTVGDAFCEDAPTPPEHSKHKNLYRCNTCLHTTYNVNSALKHQRSSHRKIEKKKVMKIKLNFKIFNLTQKEMEDEFRARELSEKYITAIYKCDICFQGYNQTRSWEEHLKSHDTTHKYVCDICNCRFSNRKHLHQHFARTHLHKCTCNVCGHVCASLYAAKTHQQQMHIISCKVCELTFDSKKSLRGHMSSAHPLACSLCEYTSQTSQGIKQHMKKHIMKTCRYTCELCSTPLKNKKDKKSHYISQHPQDVAPVAKPFICDSCGKAYKYATLLRNHSLSHSGTRQYQCAHCPKRFIQKRTLANHLTTHSDVRAYVCEVCGRSYKTNAVLHEHRTLHSGKRNHQCKHCPKTYSNAKNLWMHNKSSHSLDRPYKCELCCKGFLFKCELDKHFKKKNVHKELPPGGVLRYCCNMCNMEFASHTEVLTHRQSEHPDGVRTEAVPGSDMVHVHGKKFQFLTGPNGKCDVTRVYKCATCMRTFSNYSHLYIHNKSHSEERPFLCSHCDKGFKFKAALKRHVLVHTGEKPYKCDMCEKSFTTEHWKQQHTRRAHLNEIIPYKPRIRNNRKAQNKQSK